jgi:hypothetical protein
MRCGSHDDRRALAIAFRDIEVPHRFLLAGFGERLQVEPIAAARRLFVQGTH